MTKQHIKIGVIAILALTIIGEAVYIYKNNDVVYRDTAGTEAQEQTWIVSISADIAKINNETAPIYKIEGCPGTFFTDIDLGLFGFTCELSENQYTLSCPEGVHALSSEDFAVIPEETIAYPSDKLLNAAENQYTCYTTKTAVFIPSEAIAAMGDVMRSDSTNTTYYAFGTDEEIEKQREISINEVRMYDGTYITTDAEDAASDALTEDNQSAWDTENKEEAINE
ncbi:MAG: hypothetical protein ACI38A_11010 [Candidatus Ornithomonoglobus sp.]